MAKKILVIDDDPSTVKYLVSVLKNNGFETCEAYDGVEAMAVLQREKPDLITLDLEMPEEWGTRFYRKLRKQEGALRDTPVLIISAMPSRHLSVRDVVGYLSKPFDPGEVIDIINQNI
ncbi:MAG: response regulator [Desulfobacterales bacterium]|nr:response regulator [Desulfobacterales bacterium]